MQLRQKEKLEFADGELMSELVCRGFYQVVSSGRFWLTVIVSGTSTQSTLGSITALCCWMRGTRTQTCKRRRLHMPARICMRLCSFFTRRSPSAWILFRDLKSRDVFFFFCSWQSLQSSIHPGRRSNCFATACLRTAGPDPSPQQPQALSQLITLARKIFSQLCLQ